MQLEAESNTDSDEESVDVEDVREIPQSSSDSAKSQTILEQHKPLLFETTNTGEVAAGSRLVGPS